ncbi:MAG: hypothetical protein FWE16_03625 [Firmicutes bacterium]|nr:hypothetical protein [Bacillota bacterium]
MTQINLTRNDIVREREIKYLVHDKLSLDDILNVFMNNDYELANPPHKKSKDEIFYDDEHMTILNRGDVFRESHYRFNNDQTTHDFMYKMQNSNSNKPYVERIEIRAKTNSIDEFKTLFGNNVPQNVQPVLHASMERDYATVQKGDFLVIITLDKTTYTKNDKTYTEYMAEFEDISYVISGIDNDAHLDNVHKLLTKSGLPLELTKQSKYQRGWQKLGNY